MARGLRPVVPSYPSQVLPQSKTISTTRRLAILGQSKLTACYFHFHQVIKQELPSSYPPPTTPYPHLPLPLSLRPPNPPPSFLLQPIMPEALGQVRHKRKAAIYGGGIILRGVYKSHGLAMYSLILAFWAPTTMTRRGGRPICPSCGSHRFRVVQSIQEECALSKSTV